MAGGDANEKPCRAGRAVWRVPPPAQTWVRERAPPGPVARGTGLLRQAMMVAHNAARADFGRAPLAWDKRAWPKTRERYARELASSDAFRHSTGRRGAEPEGENLWTGHPQRVFL